MPIQKTASYEFALWLILGMASCSLPAPSQDTPASAAENQKSAADAEAPLIALSKAHPMDPQPLAQLGLFEARRGNYSKAIGYYRQAMALNPNVPGLSLNLGLAFFKNGQYKPALEIFTPMLDTQPNSSPEMQRLTVLAGMSHYGLGEYQAAVPYLQRAADRDVSNLPLLLTLAHSCLLSKQYPCVVDTYHRLVAQNADSSEADILVGEALDEMGDTTGATREFRAAAQANSKEPNVHFGLGYLLWKQMEYQEAAQEFRAELENTPDYIQAMLYLADSDIQINRMNDAESLLEKLVKSAPEISMGHLDLGIVFVDSGEKESALREFKMAAALKPDDVKVYMNLGRLYRSMGKTAEAQEEFKKAGSLNEAKNAALVELMSHSEPNAKGSPPPAQ